MMQTVTRHRCSRSSRKRASQDWIPSVASPPVEVPSCHDRDEEEDSDDDDDDDDDPYYH